MKWYKQYTTYFERPIEEMPQEFFDSLKERAKAFNSSDPLLSIVLIAHNEERRILSCIDSLLDNKIDLPAELFVVDNNSTDRTSALLERAAIRYYQESQKGPGYARQCGLDHAKGVYHFCIDSDTLYPKHYLSTHLKHLQKEGVVATFSLWSFLPSKKYPALKLFFYELFRDVFLTIQSFKRAEMCVRGMVFAFKTEAAREVGFRKDIIRGEDGSLALGLKSYGKLHFILNRKARAMTCTSIFESQNSLSGAVMIRVKKALKSICGLFTSKREYKDEESNLIK